MLPPLLNRISSLLRHRPRVERRGDKRLLPNELTPCQIHQAGDEASQAALIHNLSKSGVGLLVRTEIAVGSIIQILMVNAAHTAALATEVRIVRCTRVVSGDYLLGGEFTHTLQHDEIVPFIL